MRMHKSESPDVMVEPTVSESQAYASYLVRCWKTGGNDSSLRFVIETISGSPLRRGFATLAELLAFMEQEIEARLEVKHAE